MQPPPDGDGATDSAALPLDLLLGVLGVVNTAGPALTWSLGSAPVGGLPPAAASTLGLVGAIVLAVAVVVRVLLPRLPRPVAPAVAVALVPVAVGQAVAASSSTGGAVPMLLAAVFFTTWFAFQIATAGRTPATRVEESRNGAS